ncbi:MAG: Gfo/Idh/MocA family protein, partial [Acidimicrobiales bacterium]
MSDQHIRYGVIGTGMMGIEHIANILALDNTSVSAVADTDPGSREAGHAAAGSETSVYADHHQLLADPDVDAVVVATPNFTHIDVMRDVLATGKHVLCEK